MGLVVLVETAPEQTQGVCDQPDRPSCEAARASYCTVRLGVSEDTEVGK